jgi:hypothetical protein
LDLGLRQTKDRQASRKQDSGAEWPHRKLRPQTSAGSGKPGQRAADDIQRRPHPQACDKALGIAGRQDTLDLSFARDGLASIVYGGKTGAQREAPPVGQLVLVEIQIQRGAFMHQAYPNSHPLSESSVDQRARRKNQMSFDICGRSDNPVERRSRRHAITGQRTHQTNLNERKRNDGRLAPHGSGKKEQRDKAQRTIHGDRSLH